MGAVYSVETVPIMNLSISRWRPGHLLAAWSAYWLGLATVTLTPIVVAVMQADAAGSGPDAGALSINLGTAGVGVVVKRLGHVTLDRSASLPSIALWIALPPLVLWGVWLYRRSRAIARSAEAARAAGTPMLGEPAPEFRAAERKRANEQR